jgi:hypothetical protein
MVSKHIYHGTFSEHPEPRNEEVPDLRNIVMYSEKNNEFGKENISMNISF